jgi:LysR family transcriptional regulator, low CO2-responsive transcriptional regulator
MNQIDRGRMENVHQLRVFVAVAETLSFTRAAERLFLTQSAVSHQIAKLERELGCELLTREGRGVTLTTAGRALLHQARRVFAAIESAVDATRHAANEERGRLRIGASTTACQYLIPEALREFRECFPTYSLSIVPADSPATLEHLLAGTVDLSLMLRSERNRKVQYHALFDDELQLIVSALHPCAAAGRIDRRQLSDQRMILYSSSSTTFRLVERYFARMQMPLQDWIQVGDLGAIKELVKIGLGVSMMARWTTTAERQQGSLVSLPLPGVQLRRHWAVASLAGRPLSIAEETFISLCQAVARKVVLGEA